MAERDGQRFGPLPSTRSLIYILLVTERDATISELHAQLAAKERAHNERLETIQKGD